MNASHNRNDTETASRPQAVTLNGLDGSNPVNFLAALGVLATLSSSDDRHDVRISWRERIGVWHPVVHWVTGDVSQIAQALAVQLKCPFTPDPAAEALREQRQKSFDVKKKQFKDAVQELKRKKLRGKERDEEFANSVAPVEAGLADCRSRWLEALRQCVPSMEMSLGKHLNAEQSELRETLQDAMREASVENRTVIDLLASFGSDACSMAKSDRMEASPFCFVTGSGHQYFLDTARQLTEQVTAERIERALAQDVPASDEKLSLRWDPAEDRRYALMWSDPTASGNKSLTNWATNLLAYQGLQLLPSVPTTKGLRSVGWSTVDKISCWTWPIWNVPLTCDVVRTTLCQSFERSRKHGNGVAAVYRTNRLQVGNPPLFKINFSPAERIA